MKTRLTLKVDGQTDKYIELPFSIINMALSDRSSKLYAIYPGIILGHGSFGYVGLAQCNLPLT